MFLQKKVQALALENALKEILAEKDASRVIVVQALQGSLDVTVKAKDETIAALRQVILDQGTSYKTAMEMVQNTTIEQMKIVLQATLDQNRSLLDRIMALVGKLNEYETTRQVQADPASLLADNDAMRKELERTLAEAALRELEDQNNDPETVALKEALRGGKIIGDM